MTGYVRVDTGNNIADGNVISATDLDNEFDGVVAAFNASTGHTHGGGVGEGAPVTKIGPTNDVTVSASLLAPKTTNTVDLGSSLLKYKDLYLAGVATLGAGAVLNTPASITLTNATGLPIATGVSGLGTGVATALAVNVGSAGAPVLFNGALGTPASGVVTNLTGTASININGTVGATTANTGAFTTLAASGTTTLSGNQVINVADNTNAALRITQTGTGNALLVEDAANPDSTPFVIDNAGNVVSGYGTSVVTAGSAVAPRIQLHGAGGGSAAMGATSWATGGNVAASFVFSRSEGSVVGTQTIVDSGDHLGNIRFAGSDGTAFIEAAKITGEVDGTPGLNDMPGRLVFSTTADGASSPTERMRINNTGLSTFTAVGTGGVLGTGASFVGTNLSGATTNLGIGVTPTFGTGATVRGIGVQTTVATQAGGAGLGTAAGFRAAQGVFDTAVTSQYGFWADSTITGATNNYGFYSNIAAGTGRYNFYAAGTADNYFAGNVILNGGTANGVPYLNGSKVLTSGSALTFDGTNFATTGTSSGSRIIATSTLADGSTAHLDTSASAFGIVGGSSSMGYKATSQHIWNLSGTSEQMRLTSTGLGIGTSSPGAKLESKVATVTSANAIFTNGQNSQSLTLANAYNYNGDGGGSAVVSNGALLLRANGNNLLLDSSGNLGLGVTPSAWDTVTAFQVKTASLGGYATAGYLGTNCYYQGGWKYTQTSAATRYEFSDTHKWYTAPSGTAGNAISFTQAMTLDASGNLGVGTTAPRTALDFGNSKGVTATAGQPTLSIYSDGTNSYGIAAGASGLHISANAPGSDGQIRFFGGTTNASPVERMRIDGNGNLLVGTTSGSYKVDVSGDVNVTGSYRVNGVATTGLTGGQTGSAPLYGARSWVNFNGTGTVAIRGSGNVSSITDNGTGDYTVNFTSAMSDANYTAVTGGGIDSYGTSFSNVRQGPSSNNISSSACRIGCGFDNGALNDWQYVAVAIFR